MTEEYFAHLTDELGDEWVIVADRLKSSQAAVQRITSRYADLGRSDAMTSAIKDVLTDWFKTSSKSNDKVTGLNSPEFL